MSNDLTVQDGAAPFSPGGADSDEAGGAGSDLQRRPASTGRIAEIEAIMRDDRDRYFRDGLDQELARLRQEQAASDDPGASPLTYLGPDDSRRMLMESAEGEALATAWGGRGSDFETNLKQVQSGVSEIVRGVGDTRAQRAFMERFDRSLSESTRYAIYDEMRRGGPMVSEPASKDALNKFMAFEINREIAQEWGHSAADRVGRVHKRVSQLRSRLPADEFEGFIEWFSGLTPPAAKSIVRQLAR